MVQSALENETSFNEATTQDYIALLKFRVMRLAVFTAGVALVIAPASINPVVAIGSLICIGIGAGAAGALNMWWDSDIDSIMTRTSNRPIPAGKITCNQALSFGLFLTFFSVMFLGLFANHLSAALLAVTIAFYILIYTMFLKRRTPQNIVIGGAAGALPPVIGWAVSTNSIGFESILMFFLIFLWTPPHFWSLCLMTKSDYSKSKIPMLTETHGEEETKRQIIVYSLLLLVPSLLISFTSVGGLFYLVSTLILNAVFLYLAISLGGFGRLDKPLRKKRERQLFLYSIFYLFAHFSLLMVEFLAKFFFSFYNDFSRVLVWF